MDTPLVTVICLCYNQKAFVRESIQSVLDQTYHPIQLIIIDDASTDGSGDVIRDVLKEQPELTFLALTVNQGNCKAFNKGLELAKGEFIIDLAADDVLLRGRIEKGLAAFADHDTRVGVNFSDAELIDQDGKFLRFHSTRFPHNSIPEGDVYKDVVQRYFICSPTMMIRRSVLEHLGGYDESLAYEDFDFWVRSARDYQYCYTPEALVKRRILDDSMAHQQYRFRSKQLMSTFHVCEKIAVLNRTTEERDAFRKRLRYELRRCMQLGEIRLAGQYLGLLIKS